MSDKRVLIIAGTHERENEFSHSVADRLIQEYGPKEPDYSFLGVDKAREGRLWLYDEVAVAKIDKIGEISSDYLETCSYNDLIGLAEFKLNHEGCEFSPSIDDRFENRNQWTSVSQQLVDASEAVFYVDLHSFHAYSLVDGTGLYILPDASPANVDKMKRSLNLAKEKESQRYGSSDHDPVTAQKEIAEEISDRVVERLFKVSKRLTDDLRNALRRLDKARLINYLLDKNVDLELRNSVSILSSINSKCISYEAKATLREAEQWGDAWCFKDETAPNLSGREYFTFEAVHWQGRQQEAVVNFIRKYLVKSLSL